MKYQIQYWLKTGELMQIESGLFASVLVRQSETPESLVTFSSTLDDTFRYSILERLEDGSLTPYNP